MIVELTDLKSFLDLDRNSSERDSLVISVGEAAEAQVRDWIGRPIYHSAEAMPPVGTPLYDEGQIIADNAIRVAIKMIARSIFYAPEGFGSPDEDAVPSAAVRALLSGYRRFSVLP